VCVYKEPRKARTTIAQSRVTGYVMDRWESIFGRSVWNAHFTITSRTAVGPLVRRN